MLKIMDQHDIEFLFRGSYGIESIKESGIPIYLKVLISYVFSISVCYFFMNIINRKKSILTKWGDNSLSIFLFHPIIVLILKKDTNIMHYGVHKNAIILFAISVIVVLILGSNWFAAISNGLCNPIKYFRLSKRDMPNQCPRNV
jgi:fucose 4-O-acetylase-like acetyltransferase